MSITNIVLLLISPFMSVNICSLCLGAPMLGAYIFVIVRFYSWIDPLIMIWYASLSLVTVFVLKSILSHTGIATLAFFWFPFAWNTFFHPLTFNLCLWIWSESLIDSIYYRSCFCIHSAALCLLIRAFILFIFKVIIDTYVFTATVLIVLELFL